MTPWCGPSLGRGLAGIGAKELATPLSSVVRPRTPLVIDVEPLTPLRPVPAFDGAAVQVLATASAMRGPGPTPPVHGWAVVWPDGTQLPPIGARPMDTELVADPSWPIDPSVLTTTGPDGGSTGLAAGHRPPSTTAGP